MSGETARQPLRIQRKRTKGWQMPANAVYVGRPGMWGNWAAHRDGLTGIAAVNAFQRWVDEEASWAWKGRAVIELRGKDLACWCAVGNPCHADVLLNLANSPAAAGAASGEGET